MPRMTNEQKREIVRGLLADYRKRQQEFKGKTCFICKKLTIHNGMVTGSEEDQTKVTDHYGLIALSGPDEHFMSYGPHEGLVIICNNCFKKGVEEHDNEHA